MTWFPLCMTPEEWADWQALNPSMSRAQDYADRPCVDCPVSYAREMRAQGRCNGEPKGDDPLSAHEGFAAPLAVLPCPSCVHRPVCAMRARLESVHQVVAERPLELPKAITIQLTARVECSEYRRDRGIVEGSGVSEETRARLRAAWTPEKREAARQRLARQRAAGKV